VVAVGSAEVVLGTGAAGAVDAVEARSAGGSVVEEEAVEPSDPVEQAEIPTTRASAVTHRSVFTPGSSTPCVIERLALDQGLPYSPVAEGSGGENS
jgi:hypothetical protein